MRFLTVATHDAWGNGHVTVRLEDSQPDEYAARVLKAFLAENPGTTVDEEGLKLLADYAGCIAFHAAMAGENLVWEGNNPKGLYVSRLARYDLVVREAAPTKASGRSANRPHHR